MGQSLLCDVCEGVKFVGADGETLYCVECQRAEIERLTRELAAEKASHQKTIEQNAVHIELEEVAERERDEARESARMWKNRARRAQTPDLWDEWATIDAAREGEGETDVNE